MYLNQILQGVPHTKEIREDMEITGISYDTRTLAPGNLFVALSGYRSDGNCYIREALEKGAVAVLTATKPQCQGPWIVADNPRLALATMAANWYGNPAESLMIIGVTGTNGKTSTTYLLKGVLEGVTGKKVGLIGTNQILIGDEIYPATRTTPESLELHGLLRQMVNEGCTYVVMEVSSHALAMGRTHGLTFEASIFTNLTQDHLDFHHTMEEYREAKKDIFRQSKCAILNLDDEAGRYYQEVVSCPVITYSENKTQSDITAKNIRLFPTCVEFEGLTEEKLCRIRLPIPGGFSIYNALGVLACGLSLGLGLEEMAGALEQAEGIKGRLEVVPVPAQFTVIIDYAHSPDALENVLTSVRDFTTGKLYCLFGCGGDRDRSKRALMGNIATTLADVVVITSDNPRTEEPEGIIADILKGVVDKSTSCHVISDRRSAISFVLSQMTAGDVVVLAGKGHETYQEIQGQFYHLDEREEVEAFFALDLANQ